jgi:hypothetical protein
MIKEKRRCREIAQQVHASGCAVTAAKRAPIRDHLDHCLDAAMSGPGPGRRAGGGGVRRNCPLPLTRAPAGGAAWTLPMTDHRQRVDCQRGTCRRPQTLGEFHDPILVRRAVPQ